MHYLLKTHGERYLILRKFLSVPKLILFLEGRLFLLRAEGLP